MSSRLFKEVTDLTELPEQLISQELVEILEKAGTNPEQLTIDQLRQAMLYYLDEVMYPKS